MYYSDSSIQGFKGVRYALAQTRRLRTSFSENFGGIDSYLNDLHAPSPAITEFTITDRMNPNIQVSSAPVRADSEEAGISRDFKQPNIKELPSGCKNIANSILKSI